MKKKIKIFGIGAAILVLLLSTTPIILADQEEQEWDEFCSETQELFETYEDDIEDLDTYISEYIVTYGEIDENFTLTQELEETFLEIMEEYEVTISGTSGGGGVTKVVEYLLRFEWWLTHINFKIVWWVATTFRSIGFTATAIKAIYALHEYSIWWGHAVQLAQISHHIEGNSEMRIKNIWDDYSIYDSGIIIDTGKLLTRWIIYYLGWTWQS